MQLPQANGSFVFLQSKKTLPTIVALPPLITFFYFLLLHKKKALV